MSVVMVYLYGRDQFCEHLIWHQECSQYQILSRLSEINVNFVCNRAKYRTASAGVLDMIDVVDN